MRRISFLALLLAACLLVPSTASAARTKLGPGDSGKDVRSLQFQLAKRQYLASVTGKYDEKTKYAVLAFQSRSGLSRDGIAGSQTLKKLKTAGTPRAQTKQSGRYIEISLSSQTMLLVRSGKVSQVYPISSGRAGYATPKGTFKIFRKVVNDYSNAYNAPMPFSSYFVGGVALHSGVVPGYTTSHGCVHVPPPSASSIYYNWAKAGTTVKVY